MRGNHRLRWSVGVIVAVWVASACLAEAKCTKGCDLALASFYVSTGTTLTAIGLDFDSTNGEIMKYNPSTILNENSVISGTRINIPFPCGCIDGEFLGHIFNYTTVTGDTYTSIAQSNYSNLTTVETLQNYNNYSTNNIPENVPLNVMVNCSCGNSSVSKEYGLFITYPLRPEDTLQFVASSENLSTSLLQMYNPGINFSQGTGIVYIPGKDLNGSYRPLTSSKGLAGGIIAGISIAAVVTVLASALFLYFGVYKKKRVRGAMLLSGSQELSSPQTRNGLGSATVVDESAGATGMAGITVDKSVEFTYDELAKETNNFNLANKIGQGGFGAVYYAKLRGEKAAIKKMDMQASREFLAELKVLTHVHHLNLVRLIGYCVETNLFLVYEYIENGNLSQHLRGSEREPMSWDTRVQIALDSARGLEYIHEHTVPVYIHRDIKSANILIDKNYHAKVADFGLAKLTEVGSASLGTRLVGTFGYMPPEYAQYGDISSKVDVYAFGVVLYELISAKEAVVKQSETMTESKGLVALFEEVLNQPDQKDEICRLVDPRLGDNYPIDSVRKMAQLAKACTQENPQLRPSMRSIVVALMTLSSTTEDWDVGSFYENTALVNLMSGR